MRFKAGDKVICIEPGIEISYGKVYEVYIADTTYLYFQNLYGAYWHSRFVPYSSLVAELC